eukprot:superscaffoldBa00000190_g2543
MALERQKQDQLKIDKLQWKWVMMGEEPVTSLKFSLSDLEKEQQRRHKEAELCHLQKVEDKASLKCLTSKLQGKEQSKRKTLREQKTDCETVEKEIHPHGSTHPPSAEKASPKTETTKAAKSYKSLLRVQERLRFEFWFEKHQDQRERKKEAHRLKAERRCAKQAACKESRWSYLSEQFDCYTEGFTMSEKAGEIATIPLTRIINERYRAYSWVAELIQVFIAISVTVSFLVMGSAMKHTIDGLVSSLWSSRLEWLSKAWERNLPNKQHICSARSVAKGFMSLLGFSVIFIVSVCDPRGFVVMLDKVVSFSLNTEVGLFVFIMLRESREDRFQHLSVPLPVGDCVFSLTWLLPTYFLFAVTYDVLQTLADVAHYLPLYSHSQRPYNHSYSLTGSSASANLSVLL